MKKRLLPAVLLAAALTLLPVTASAAELDPEPPLAEAESYAEAGEEMAEDENPEVGELFVEEDGSAPLDSLAGPAEPEPDPEPDPDGPLTPGLDMENHRVYIRGSGDKVNPEGILTRAEAACMIYSLLEYEPQPEGTAAFSDVPAGAWYGPQVLALAEAGALNGYQDGSFHPSANITRGSLWSYSPASLSLWTAPRTRSRM